MKRKQTRASGDNKSASSPATTAAKRPRMTKAQAMEVEDLAFDLNGDAELAMRAIVSHDEVAVVEVMKKRWSSIEDKYARKLSFLHEEAENGRDVGTEIHRLRRILGAAKSPFWRERVKFLSKNTRRA